jgi:hypothetical protein
MRKGDIIVMPLEFQYFQQAKISDWFANNMIAWGEDDYLKQLDFLSLLQFLISVPKSRVYEGILSLNRKKHILEEEAAIASLEELLNNKGVAWRGYSYTSLNRYGDMISGDRVNDRMIADSKKGFHYYGGWDISDRFFKYYKQIERLERRSPLLGPPAKL